MTFKHKLSKRLALIRGLWLAAAVAAVACNETSMSGPHAVAIGSASLTTTFNVGDRVKTTGTANVRSGPKGSASLLGAQPISALGYILGGPIVDSTGDKLTRFNVNFDNSPDGWVAQEYAGLTLVAAAPPPSAPTVASVAVTPSTASMLVGATVQLAATPKDSAGNTLSGQTITWSSGSASIATVSASGLVTGVAAGSATITATSGGKSGTAAVSVTAPAPTVASVAVSPSTASVVVGATAQLAASPKDASGNPVSGQTVTWTTSSASIASVSASGLVTGVAAGSATITATSGGKSGTAAVTVTAPTAPTTPTFYVGGRVQVGSSGVNVRSAPSISGTLLGAQPAGALGTIVAGPVVDSTGDKLTRWNVNFDAGVDGWAAQDYLIALSAPTPPPPAPTVASVIVSPKPASVISGQTVQLSAVAKDSTGTTLSGATMTWLSRDTTKAKVSSSGLVTGIALGTAYVLATSGGKSDSSAVTVSQVPVATVSISPATASINVAATVQLAATTKDASGATLTGRTVTWTTSSAAIAGVSASGLVTGVAAGTATITGTSEGKSGTATVTVTAPAPPPPTSHAGWYAAPNGSSGGSGSMSSPWNLSTALSGAGGKVQPGDTVWVRAGTYYAPFRSTLTGTAAAPIVVRAYPGERAIVDGVNTTNDNFVVAGSYSVIWGLEFTNTNPSRYTSDATSHSYRADNIINQGPHNKYVNLVVHDGGVAFYTYSAYADLVVYGSILYNNGWDSSDRGHGHALYLKNDNGPVVAKDNVIFNQFGYGIHMYTNTGDGLLNGLWAEGNISFDNGSISQWTTSANIGNLGQPLANNMGIVNNMTYFAPSLSGTNLTLGSGSGLTATGNYVVGGSGITQGTWSGATISGNSVLSAALASRAPTVFVRPNLYEAGRANVVVYNPSGQGSVSVDLTGVLSIGDSYVVRNVQDLFGTPVASGTYGGGSISIPMGGVTPPVPIGLSSSRAPRTGPYFDTFLVTKN